MNDGYEIRVMSPADIDRAVDWAAAEGWNPGAADAGCFASVDPEGFIGGWLDGEMIASISVVNYDPRFAFLGFYIVMPPHRGKGYGYRLWRKAIEHAGTRLIGLDGVLAEQGNYRRSGFEFAYRNVRYGGIPQSAGAPPLPDGTAIERVNLLTSDIQGYDRLVFPSERTSFLEAWISDPGHVSLFAKRNREIVGFGTIRPCRTGHKIGPLFADDRITAEALAGALISDASAKDEVFLDVPEPNGPAVELAKSLRLEPVFETARMYTGAAPEIDLNRIFGVTTFELG